MDEERVAEIHGSGIPCREDLPTASGVKHP